MGFSACLCLTPSNQLSIFPIPSISPLGFASVEGIAGDFSLRLKYRPYNRQTRRNTAAPTSTRIHFGCNSAMSPSDLAPTAAAAYGTLLLGGGLYAYARSGSKGSVFGGLTGGALMGAAYYLMQGSEAKEIGYAIGFGSAFLFASVFGIRLAATGKVIPAGPLLGLSIGALAVFLSAYLQANAAV